MDDPTKNIEVRLNALEFLVRGIWGAFLAVMPPDHARNISASVVDRSRKWKRPEGAPLRDVEELEEEAAVVSAWVERLIEDARAIEQAFRQSQSKGTKSS